MTPLLTQPEFDALARVAVAKAAQLGLTTACDIGHVDQRERIALLADRACQSGPGDLIEIGAYTGATSEILATIANKYGRKLIIVDSWKGGDSFALQDVGMQFVKSMSAKGWIDNPRSLEIAIADGTQVAFYGETLIVLKADAHTPEAREFIQKRRYCFAFSDDGHDHWIHCHELETLLPVCDGLIAADDCYLPFARQAVLDTVPKFPGWQIIEHPRMSELWIIKADPVDEDAPCSN